MSLSYITNGESGASVRATLNAMIDIVNFYSSSVFTGSNAPQSVSFTVYDGFPTINGSTTKEGACTAYTNGTTPHTLYIVKGSGNTNQNQVESGDIVYVDAGLTGNPQVGVWFSYFNSFMMNSYAFQVGPVGVVQSSEICTVAPSYSTTMVYDTAGSPAVFSGTDTAQDACNAINSGTSHTLYFTKTAPNTGAQLEQGDNVYTDSGLSQTLPAGKWFGWYDSMQMANKAFQVSPTSTVQSVDTCQVALSATLYSSTPASLNPSSTSIDACNSTQMPYTYTVYYTKGAGNMNTYTLEVNDILYTDGPKTTPVTSGWYGYNATAINYSIEVGAGGIVTTKNNC
jgi:hypothetical protein